MLHIAIVEDEESALNQIQEFVGRYQEEYQCEFQVSCFLDGSEILKHFMPVYDIIFMDIDMPKVDGMEAARRIRACDSEAVLVFITNLAKYAISAYEVEALDYVLKPITYIKFSSKLTNAIKMAERKQSGQILLRMSDRTVRLDTAMIYYVEIQNGILSYMTEQGQYQLRGTLQSAEEELRAYHFVRCSNWCLVNLRHVDRVKKDSLIVMGNELQISRRNKSAFMEAFADYVGGGL